jgi:hypothetical protein
VFRHRVNQLGEQRTKRVEEVVEGRGHPIDQKQVFKDLPTIGQHLVIRILERV